MPTEQFPAASPLDEVVAALDVGDRSAAPDAERDNSDDKTSVFISRPPPDPSIDDDEATTIHVARTNDEPSVEIEIVTEELHAPAPSVVEEPTPRTDVVTRAKDPFEDTGPVLSHANAAQPAPVESPRVFAARPQTPTMASAPVPPPLTPEPTPLPSIIISDDAAETAGDGGFSPESEITPRPDVPLPAPSGKRALSRSRPGAPERVEVLSENRARHAGGRGPAPCTAARRAIVQRAGDIGARGWHGHARKLAVREASLVQRQPDSDDTRGPNGKPARRDSVELALAFWRVALRSTKRAGAVPRRISATDGRDVRSTSGTPLTVQIAQ